MEAYWKRYLVCDPDKSGSYLVRDCTTQKPFIAVFEYEDRRWHYRGLELDHEWLEWCEIPT